MNYENGNGNNVAMLPNSLENIPMDPDATDDNLALTNAFSVALKEELDRICFPPAPERVLELMKILHLSKPQIYRIVSGKAVPTLSSLMQLRTLGISIDDILDRLRGAQKLDVLEEKDRIECQIEISGVLIPCSVALAPSSIHSSLVAIKGHDKNWRLLPVKPGTIPPEGSRPIGDIRFSDIRPRIAVVDDDPGTLTTLCKQLEPYFNAIPFPEGSAVLKTQVKNYAALIIDWRLPDINGEELVRKLRDLSKAPIFIVTGEKEASRHEIARAIENTGVNFVIKPVDEIILAAQISQAIRK